MVEEFEVNNYVKGRKILLERSIEHPFNRSLSSIDSFSHMEKNNLIPDYTYKIVLVGDSKVGKTSLLMTYIQKQFPKSNVPRVFANCTTDLQTFNNKSVQLLIWDTSNNDEYKRLRPISYSEVDLVIICYAINDEQSLTNIERKWIPEVKHFCYNVPFVIVGLKSDLCSNSFQNDNTLIDEEKIRQMTEKVNCKAYLQCSSLKNKGVDDVLDIALSLLMKDECMVTNSSESDMTPKQSEGSPILSRIKKIRKTSCHIM